MCSIGDDNLDEQQVQKYLPGIDAKLSLNDKCNKCRNGKPCVVLRQKDAYCKECFLNATTHKFKAFLGKHRFIHSGDNVLISYKEGQESGALLHLIKSGLDLKTHNKLRFTPFIVYVERNFHLKLDLRKHIMAEIEKQCKVFNFTVFFVSFLDYFLDNSKVSDLLKENWNDLILNESDHLKIKDLLKDKQLLTNKLEYMKIVEKKLLYKIANLLSCKIIFTPELGDNIAADLLTNISLGRGIHLPLDIGVCDDRHPLIKIVRPLRHFDFKEAAMYNYFHAVPIVSRPAQAENSINSIQGLMKKFVSNLQTNFPATVTTIVRTGDKLAMDESLKNNPKCKLCLAPVENVTDNLTSAESTMFSSLVSHQQIDKELAPDESFSKTVSQFKKLTVGDYCYACLKVNGIKFDR